VTYDLPLLHGVLGSGHKRVKRKTKTGAGTKGNEQLQHKPLDLQEITSLLTVFQQFVLKYLAGNLIEVGIFHTRLNKDILNILL
jgi:hypothetical protein